MNFPKITVDTPLEEVKRIHQDIWQYVVENGHKPMTPYICNCVGCYYAHLRHSDCHGCPIDWENSGTRNCLEANSVFDLWVNEDDGDVRRHLAELIRDVKWKFEKEE